MNESIFGSLAKKAASPAPKTPPARVSNPAAPPSESAASAEPAPRAVLVVASESPPPAAAPKQKPAQPASPAWSVSSDVAILAILESPIHAFETAAVGFARKESELRHIFSTLSILESRVLHSRLSSPLSGDQLAQAFTRLTADRRARLINFLADARRRAACHR